MQVSVTVITKNEEQGLRAMLESVRWAGEIIVVDCGSTDRTVEIAREYTDEVVHHDFVDFASQKNFAQSRAKYDWVLNLDADERCTPELAAEITALADGGCSAYWISRRNQFQGRWIRHCGWAPDDKLRLYRRSLGLWKGKVHESVQMENPADTRRLSHSIEHYTYKSFDRYVGSVHQFARLAAEQMDEQGRSAGVLDLMFRPPAAFLKKYLFQAGILDGSPGFVISMLTAYAVFCRYAILRDIARKNDTPYAAARNENHPR